MMSEDKSKDNTRNEILYSLTSGYNASMFWCTIFTFIVYVIGFSTSNWYISSTLNGTLKHGLWEQCICKGSIQEGIKSDLQASQAMAILSFIFSISSIIFCCLYNFIDRFDKIKLIIGFMVCIIVTLILNIISISVYGVVASKMEDQGINGNYGFSFVLVILSIFGNIASLFLAIMQYARGNTLSLNE